MRQQGKVIWCSPDRGYGFIQNADGGRDVFVSAVQVERSGLNMLFEHQSVEFDLATRENGKQEARNLRIV
jgi:CspA family cold shock protein